MKVIIGDITEYLADYAKSLDKDAYLIDHSNADQKHTGVVYASLGDLDLSFFHQIIINAQEVEYYPPERWSSDILKTTTETELKRMSYNFDIKGIEKIILKYDCLGPIDDRKTDGSQIWCAGCSFTFGTGVSREQAWPYLLGNLLNANVSSLSRPGASIRWASDQILMSDIRSGDKVFWGLTTVNRFPCYTNETTIHSNINTIDNAIIKKYYTPDLILDREILWNESIIGIKKVINFCQKLGAELYLIGLLDNNELQNYIQCELTYLDLNIPRQNYIDYGNDNEHPGPRQHADYARRIVEWIHTQF